MVEHDGHVGQVLNKLMELGLDDNTIVMYSTDNGAEKFTWPDGGQSPFRGEKNTNWEGGYRVPCLLRWPGVVKPGTEVNDVMSHEDWLPTFMAAAAIRGAIDGRDHGNRAADDGAVAGVARIIPAGAPAAPSTGVLHPRAALGRFPRRIFGQRGRQI